MESFFGTVMVPSSADSSPAIIRKSVVLPAPFGPTSPAFSPGLSWKEASTKMTWRPYCLLTEAKEIMEWASTPRVAPLFVGRRLWTLVRVHASVRTANAHPSNHLQPTKSTHRLWPLGSAWAANHD